MLSVDDVVRSFVLDALETVFLKTLIDRIVQKIFVIKTPEFVQIFKKVYDLPVPLFRFVNQTNFFFF